MRYEYYPMVTRDARGVGRYDWTTNQVLIGGIGRVPVDTGVAVNSHQLAPRLGLAWRIRNRTVIRTGYGISIDPFPLAIPLRSSYPTVIDETIVAPKNYAPAGRLSDGIPLATLPNLSSGSVPLPTSVTTQTIEGNFHRGYVESFTFTVQRGIGQGLRSAGGLRRFPQHTAYQRGGHQRSGPGGGVAGRPYYRHSGGRWRPRCTSQASPRTTTLCRRNSHGSSPRASA